MGVFKKICKGIETDVKNAVESYKKNNTPELVKARLQAQIEIEKLKIERDKILNDRRKAKEQSFKVGI